MAGPDKIPATARKVLRTLIDLCELEPEHDWYFPAAQVAHELGAGSDGYAFAAAALDAFVAEGKVITKQSEFGTLYRAVSDARKEELSHA